MKDRQRSRSSGSECGDRRRTSNSKTDVVVVEAAGEVVKDGRSASNAAWAAGKYTGKRTDSDSDLGLDLDSG